MCLLLFQTRSRRTTEGHLDAFERVVIDTTNASSVEPSGPGPGKATLDCHPPQNMCVRCVRRTAMRSFQAELVMAFAEHSEPVIARFARVVVIRSGPGPSVLYYFPAVEGPCSCFLQYKIFKSSHCVVNSRNLALTRPSSSTRLQIFSLFTDNILTL